MNLEEQKDPKPEPVVLIILDGWGVAPAGEGNAISQAKTPFFNELTAHYPCWTLEASGAAVGLPEGVPGNGAAGHLNLGAGRVCYQGREVINRAIADGSFFRNPALLEAVKHVKKHGSRLHLMGLVSAGETHASWRQLVSLLELAKRKKLSEVYVHCFLEGRDRALSDSREIIGRLEKTLNDLGVGAIASLSGRWFAMDRDNYWPRTAAAYQVLIGQAGERSGSPLKALAKSREQKVAADKFLPTIIVDQANQPRGPLGDNDAVVFFNYRPDRARQLTKALTAREERPWEGKNLANLFFVTFVEYEKDLPVTVAFSQAEVADGLSETVARAGGRQLKVAETEKYVYVTNFFNGGRSEPFANEEWLLVPAVGSGDRAAKPALAAAAITDQVLAKMETNHYDLIVVNYATADMVAHGGQTTAVVKATAALDKCLKRLVKKIIEVGGVAVLTADHGQAEAMLDLSLGSTAKGHSLNPVPLIIVGKNWQGYNLGQADAPGGDLSLLQPAGRLADVAPTILKLMNLPQPAKMTGRSLL